MVPLLAGSDHTTTAAQDLNHGLQVLGSIAVVIIGGRYLLRPVFRIVAKTGLREVSTATALLVVIGTAWLMELVGVSMALGAFLAGLLLADSEYRHELESQIEPFKGLLLGLFFISVGMGANIGLLFSTPFVVLGLTLLLIAIKLPLLYAVGQMVGELNRESAVRLGVVLAAGGEFAFVVFKIGRDQGLFCSASVRRVSPDHHPVDGPHPAAVAAVPQAVSTQDQTGGSARRVPRHRERRATGGDRGHGPYGADRGADPAGAEHFVYRPRHLSGNHRADPQFRWHAGVLR